MWLTPSEKGALLDGGLFCEHAVFVWTVSVVYHQQHLIQNVTAAIIIQRSSQSSVINETMTSLIGKALTDY